MESDMKGYWWNGQWAAVEVGGGLGIWNFFPSKLGKGGPWSDRRE